MRRYFAPARRRPATETAARMLAAITMMPPLGRTGERSSRCALALRFLSAHPNKAALSR
jgi:hypothetical protein